MILGQLDIDECIALALDEDALIEAHPELYPPFDDPEEEDE